MFSPLSLAIAVTGGIYLLFSGAGSLRRRLIQKYTGVEDVPFLGIPRRMNSKIKGTALVCGGR
jgi:hypothetical protein